MPRSPLLVLSNMSAGPDPTSRNQFFDPTGEDTRQSQALAGLMDALDTTTGTNSTGRFETAQADRAAHEQQQTDAAQMRGLQLKTAESAFQGPEGWARPTPAVAAADTGLDTSRKMFGLERELQPAEENMKDVAASRAGSRYFLPSVSAQRESDLGNTMGKIASQYILPKQLEGETALAGKELELQGKLGENAARSGVNDAANAGHLLDLYKTSMTTPNVLPPEQQQLLSGILQAVLGRMGVKLPAAPAPGGGQ